MWILIIAVIAVVAVMLDNAKDKAIAKRFNSGRSLEDEPPKTITTKFQGEQSLDYIVSYINDHGKTPYGKVYVESFNPPCLVVKLGELVEVEIVFMKELPDNAGTYSFEMRIEGAYCDEVGYMVPNAHKFLDYFVDDVFAVIKNRDSGAKLYNKSLSII